MKKLVNFFVFTPLILLSQVKYPSLLWKISGNGLKKNSYLYGTMHVSNRVAYYLSEQFFDALKAVDVVGLETNPGEWLENMEKTGELSEINQLRAFNFYNQNFYKTAFTINFPEKKMLQGILSYDPDIIDGLLYRQNRSKENFEESTYIDLFIFQSASKLNKKLISLESFAQSEIKAKLSAMPDEQKDDAENKNYNNLFSITQKIEDAYREGNLDMLDSLSKLSSSKNTQRYLIQDRNVFFVNTIDSVLKTKTLFSGVGAAHLPGEKGVIELLRKKGYTVEPIIPTVSKKSHKVREELDLMVKNVSFQKQYSVDSLFSVNLPGKMYPIVNLENIKYFIHADMVNGSFYTVVRLKHLGPLFNISSDQLMARVDSLLFEHIPGKIISKKAIVSNTGIKGLEITNRTRRGDDQHYQIFFTDVELLLFKLGGKHQYATGNEAKQFFNSIQFFPKTDNVVEFTPKTKGFSVKIPANYSYVKNDGSSMATLVEDLFVFNKQKNQIMGVKQAVYNDFNYLEEDTFELSRFSKNILVNYNYTITPQTKNTSEQGFPCVRFSAKSKKGSWLYAKLYIKGIHYYYCYLISEQEDSFENEFFTSFRLTDFEYINPIKEITDRDFCFKAKDEVSENAMSRFNEAFAKEYEATQPRKDTVKNDYDYRTSSKFYYSPSSNEYVNIVYEKFNDYDYIDVKEIDKKISDSFKNNTSMFIADKSVSNENGIYKFNCKLKDTATSRAIDVRVFVKNGMRYEISTPYDTTIGIKGWAKGFMDSFVPIDTIIGKDIFKNKFSTLLKDLSGTDTALRQAANVSVRNSLGMQKAYIDEFVSFIASKKMDLVNEDSRAQLIVNAGTVENEKIIEPYKNLYKHYTDSFYLQLCVLKGLAFLKTQKSYDTFYGLLLEETPLVGADNTIADVFNALHDSLELCRKFFPGMLVLTKYDEYRDAVYSLFSELVNRKIISSQVYASYKESILQDANLALKRYTPSSTKSIGSSDYGNFDHLDKNTKELAENIKFNLDGLSNNSLYKGTDYLISLEYLNRPSILNYAYILSPFYKTDEKVKGFLTKLSKIKNQNIAMPLTINLLKQNVEMNDSLVTYYCKNKYTRAFFYSELEKEKLTGRFDKKYLSQESLIESVLASHKQLGSFYNYEKEKIKKDSLILVKVVSGKNKYQSGKIFIYKALKTKNDDEQWSAVFVEDSKSEISSKIQIVSASYFVDPSKTEAENINEVSDYFNLAFRKRANPTNSSYDQ